MEALRSALHFALENPHSDFYRRIYGVHWRRLLEGSFSELPLLTREDIEAVPFYERIFVPKELVRMVRSTSGSSGRRIIAFPGLEMGELARMREALGFRPDPVFGTNYFGPFFRKEHEYTMLMFLAWSPAHASQLQEADGHVLVDGDFQQPTLTAALSREAGVDSILGFPSPLLVMAPALTDAGVAERIRFILCVGERVSALQHRALVGVFPNARIAVLYASTDTQGVVAYTCSARLSDAPNFMHVAEGQYLLELADPDTGAPMRVTAGVEGEAIVTSLLPQGLPLIRYRTGDYARVLQTGLCECGSSAPVVDVLGRVALDRVKVQGGGISAAALDEAIAALPFTVEDFNATFRQGDTPPSLAVTLYSDAAFSGDVALMLAHELKINAKESYADIAARGALGALAATIEKTTAFRSVGAATKRKRFSIIR